MKARTSLKKFLKEAFDRGQKAFINYDRLVIDSNTYIFDEHNEMIVPINR